MSSGVWEGLQLSAVAANTKAVASSNRQLGPGSWGHSALQTQQQQHLRGRVEIPGAAGAASRVPSSKPVQAGGVSSGDALQIIRPAGPATRSRVGQPFTGFVIKPQLTSTATVHARRTSQGSRQSALGGWHQRPVAGAMPCPARIAAAARPRAAPAWWLAGGGRGRRRAVEMAAGRC